MESDPTAKLCECGCGEPTSIARWNRKSTGDVTGKPRRFRKGHSLRFARRPGNILTEADYRVEDRGYSTPCWIWFWQARVGYGYARVRLGGRKVLAHRAMYEQEVGVIPHGMTIDHLCEQKDCVRPGHMQVVTLQENIRLRDSRRLRHR